MNTGKLYADKKAYVESLNVMFAPLRDFDSIKYARSYITEQEYIKIADKLGGCAFLDVTAMSAECILKELASLILGNVPRSCVTSKDAKRKIVSLFK